MKRRSLSNWKSAGALAIAAAVAAGCGSSGGAHRASGSDGGPGAGGSAGHAGSGGSAGGPVDGGGGGGASDAGPVAKVWSVALDTTIDWDVVAVDESSGKVALAGNNSNGTYVELRDAKSGHALWDVGPLDPGFPVAVAIGKDAVYFASAPSGLFKLALSDGSTSWSVQDSAGGHITALAVDDSRAYIAGGDAVSGSSNDREWFIAGHDVSSGFERWRTMYNPHTPSSSQGKDYDSASDLVLRSGTLYALGNGADAFHVVSIDAAMGTPAGADFPVHYLQGTADKVTFQVDASSIYVAGEDQKTHHWDIKQYSVADDSAGWSKEFSPQPVDAMLSVGGTLYAAQGGLPLGGVSTKDGSRTWQATSALPDFKQYTGDSMANSRMFQMTPSFIYYITTWSSSGQQLDKIPNGIP